MSDHNARENEPLSATAGFVIFLGAFIVIGWFALYALMRSRW